MGKINGETIHACLKYHTKNGAFFDHVFVPFAWVEEAARFESASEFAWRRPLVWEVESSNRHLHWERRAQKGQKRPINPRVIVDLECDIIASDGRRDRALYSEYGVPLASVIDGRTDEIYFQCQAESNPETDATVGRATERFLFLVRDTPNVEWYVVTERPELALGWMANAELTDPAETLPNLHIGIIARNQDEFNKRTAALEHVPAASKFAIISRMSASICVADAGDFNPLDTYFGSDKPFYSMMILRGEIGRNPGQCNLVVVRDIVIECSRWRVPVWVERIGGNVTGFNCCAPDHPLTKINPTFPRIGKPIKSPDGSEITEWPEEIRERQEPDYYQTAELHKGYKRD